MEDQKNTTRPRYIHILMHDGKILATYSNDKCARRHLNKQREARAADIDKVHPFREAARINSLDFPKWTIERYPINYR